MAIAAIVTWYLGFTNTKSSRVKAIARKRQTYSWGEVAPEISLTKEWDQGRSADRNHVAAAKALAEKMGWSGIWVSGGMPSMDGNAYVCISPKPYAPEKAHKRVTDLLGQEGVDWFKVP